MAHIPKAELAEQPIEDLTPQQVARLYVRNQKALVERKFFEVVTPEFMDGILRKLGDMAENGHVRAAELLLKLAMSETKGIDTAVREKPFVFNFTTSAAAPPVKVVENTANGGGDER